MVIDTLAKVRDAKGYEQSSYGDEYATASDIRIGRRQRERARVRLRAAAAQQTGDCLLLAFLAPLSRIALKCWWPL